MNYKPDLLAAGQQLAALNLRFRMATNLGNYREAVRSLTLLIEEAENAKKIAESARVFEEEKFKARYAAAQEQKANEYAS